MNIPQETDFIEWDAGQIGDTELARIEVFFAEMLAGARALGPRYYLAARALQAEHDSARVMRDRRGRRD